MSDHSPSFHSPSPRQPNLHATTPSKLPRHNTLHAAMPPPVHAAAPPTEHTASSLSLTLFVSRFSLSHSQISLEATSVQIWP
uniref:Uncharacterized protein n=2 Tax=Fagus sylvatica TaxID=28930 RepID=A0A2N9FWQ5_FAGSY